VGLGSGDIAVLGALDLREHFRAHVSSTRITSVAYSADGRALALGDAGGTVWVLALRSYDGAPVRALELTGRCAGAVRAIDWDATGEFLRANSDGRDLRHWAVRSAEPCRPSAVRDCVWASASCPLTWASRGASDRDEGAAARPTCAALAANEHERTLLLVGDEGGGLAVYAYPSATPGAERRRVVAHGGAVLAVGTCGAASAASVDSHDGCILLWSLGSQSRANEDR